MLNAFELTPIDCVLFIYIYVFVVSLLGRAVILVDDSRNLATIATGLGMSDNTAGVTLLALGRSFLKHTLSEWIRKDRTLRSEILP